MARLGVLAGYDDDLAVQATRLTTRLRDALTHIHLAPESLLGPRLGRGGVLDLFATATCCLFLSHTTSLMIVVLGDYLDGTSHKQASVATTD